MEGQSQLAESSRVEGKGEDDRPFLEWEERLHVGEHIPGKMNECFCPCQVHWAVGWNLWFMTLFHESLPVKAVQGISGRAETQPTHL